MEMVLHAINWFEIPVSAFEKAKAFYSNILDFKMPDSNVGDKRMGFSLYEFQKEGIGGAIVKTDGFKPFKVGAKIYLNGGTDLNTVLQRVGQAGGKTIMEKTFVNEQVVFIGSFEDTEGNEVYLHSRN